jgi:hypothetical protein
VPPRGNSDFTLAVEREGHLDASAAFYNRKPRREHLLSIKYLGVLKANAKSEAADRLVARNTKRRDAAICIDKPEPDAFAWPYTHADEEADLQRRRSRAIKTTGFTGDEFERLDERNEKGLLVDLLLKELSLEEEGNLQAVERLSQNTLIWQCRARYAQSLKYSQGCPSEFLNGPFRARLGQYISFQNAVMKAILKEEADCLTETERWLAKVPAKDKSRVADILSEARELKLDLERYRAMKFSLEEHAKRLKGREEDGEGGTGSFGLLYSQLVLRRLTTNPEKLRGRSGSIGLLNRAPLMGTEEPDDGSDEGDAGADGGADGVPTVAEPYDSTSLEGEPSLDLLPTTGNDDPARTPSDNRQASLETPQYEAFHPTSSLNPTSSFQPTSSFHPTSSFYPTSSFHPTESFHPTASSHPTDTPDSDPDCSSITHSRPLPLPSIQRPMCYNRSIVSGTDAETQPDVDEPQYTPLHSIMHTFSGAGASRSGSGELAPVPESVSECSEGTGREAAAEHAQSEYSMSDAQGEVRDDGSPRDA